MIGTLLGEIVTTVLGEAIGEYVFPASSEPPPVEGEWNASLGMISILVSGLAAAFSVGVAFVLADPQASSGLYLLYFALLLCGLMAVAGLRLANRAMVVTKRRRVLAHVARWLAAFTLVISISSFMWNLFK